MGCSTRSCRACRKCRCSLGRCIFACPTSTQQRRRSARARGTIVQEPTEIPGGDYSLVAADPKGAAFGLIGSRKKQAMIAKNTLCLWYDKDAKEAARFSTATFPGRPVGSIEVAPLDYPSGNKGDVLVIHFTVCGIPCFGMNGGPESQTQHRVQLPNCDRRSGRDRPLLERNHRQRPAKLASAAGARTNGGYRGRSCRAFYLMRRPPAERSPNALLPA